MPVVGLLVPEPAAAAAGAAPGAVTYRESWELPRDAHLCISWDHLYVNTPDNMESSEDLAYEWLKRNRYKLRSDGTMTGTPLRLELAPEEAARMRAEEAAEAAERANANSAAFAAAAAAADADAAARAEAMDQVDREGLNEELDIPEIDLM